MTIQETEAKIMLAERMSRVKPSPILAIMSLARNLRSQGHNIIDLSIGEPDFDTPDYIKQAAIDAMHRGETRYTEPSGTPKLRAAIQAKFMRENGLDYPLEAITVGCGAKQLIFNALFASLDSDSEVIIPAPYWTSYPDMTSLAGGKPVIVPCSAKDGFKLKPDTLDAVLTPASQWLILNSPSNPTGAVYTRDELAELAKVIRRHPRLMVMSDDIYEHLIYEHQEFHTLAKTAPDLFDRILTINGVSKAYCMTGWRLGYAGGPTSLIKAMTTIQSQSSAHACSISQAAAAAALAGDQDFLKHYRSTLERRRNHLIAALNATPGLHCDKPAGAFYMYLSCSDIIGKVKPDGSSIQSDNDLATYLLESEGVAIVPGSAFGFSPHFRVSYAASDTALQEGCQAIQRALQQLT